MRIYERINRRGITLAPLGRPRRTLSLHEIRTAVRTSVRVVADDCAAWCAEDRDQWAAAANPFDLFGPLRLPFDSMWFEWRYPRALGGGETTFASWATAYEPSGDDSLPDGCAQMLSSVLFIADRSRLRYSPIVTELAVDDAGRVLAAYTSDSMTADYSAYTRSGLIPSLAAIGFMNCRNVEVTESAEEQQASSPQRRRGKRKPVQPLKFHTVVLPNRGLRRNRATARELRGDPTPLRKVRGHFKTYTAEAPLLGRHVGTYWWHWAVRGLRGDGVIETDYRVGPATRGDP